MVDFSELYNEAKELDDFETLFTEAVSLEKEPQEDTADKKAKVDLKKKPQVNLKKEPENTDNQNTQEQQTKNEEAEVPETDNTAVAVQPANNTQNPQNQDAAQISAQAQKDAQIDTSTFGGKVKKFVQDVADKGQQAMKNPTINRAVNQVISTGINRAMGMKGMGGYGMGGYNYGMGMGGYGSGMGGYGY